MKREYPMSVSEHRAELKALQEGFENLSEKILLRLKAGGGVSRLARDIGVSRQTLYAWMEERQITVGRTGRLQSGPKGPHVRKEKSQ